jgi:hypothetical protein
MRCKQGDLAVFVRSDAGNEGRVVTCVRLAAIGELEMLGWRLDVGPVWVIDRGVLTNHGRLVPLAADSYLCPLRDPGEDAKDETLQWKEVPTKQKEPA